MNFQSCVGLCEGVVCKDDGDVSVCKDARDNKDGLQLWPRFISFSLPTEAEHAAGVNAMCCSQLVTCVLGRPSAEPDIWGTLHTKNSVTSG